MLIPFSTALISLNSPLAKVFRPTNLRFDRITKSIHLLMLPFLLASIDLKICTSLRTILSLDFSENPSLVFLACESNQITNLNVSNNHVLDGLSCNQNQLIFLDVSKNVALGLLYCSDNQLNTLDVSNNTALSSLDCGNNQLNTLDISKNTVLGPGNSYNPALNISNMPSLYQVCVWEMPFPPEDFVVDTTGSPNIYFTTDCSK